MLLCIISELQSDEADDASLVARWIDEADDEALGLTTHRSSSSLLCSLNPFASFPKSILSIPYSLCSLKSEDLCWATSERRRRGHSISGGLTALLTAHSGNNCCAMKVYTCASESVLAEYIAFPTAKGNDLDESKLLNWFERNKLGAKLGKVVLRIVPVFLELVCSLFKQGIDYKVITVLQQGIILQ